MCKYYAEVFEFKWWIASLVISRGREKITFVVLFLLLFPQSHAWVQMHETNDDNRVNRDYTELTNGIRIYSSKHQKTPGRTFLFSLRLISNAQYIVNRPVHSGNMSSDIVVIACCSSSRTFRRNVTVYIYRPLRLIHNNTFLRFKILYTFSNTRPAVPHISLLSQYPVSI